MIYGIRRVFSGEVWMDPSTAAALMRHSASPSHIASPLHQMQARDRRIPTLSSRQNEVVNLIAQGFKNADIAAKLCLSQQTVKSHLHSVFATLRVSDRLELALYVIEQFCRFRSSDSLGLNQTTANNQQVPLYTGC